MIVNKTARVCLVGIIAALMLAGCERAAAGPEKTKAAAKAPTGFSFAVYGDSRSMMYLPYKADEEAEARKLMVDMFALALPEKVSEAAGGRPARTEDEVHAQSLQTPIGRAVRERGAVAARARE